MTHDQYLSLIGATNPPTPGQRIAHRTLADALTSLFNLILNALQGREHITLKVNGAEQDWMAR